MNNGYSFLDKLASDLGSSRTDSELLNLVLDRCIEFTAATSGTLVILSDDGYMDVSVARGFTEHIQQDMRLKVGQGITGWVAAAGEPYLCKDTEVDPKYYRVKGNIRSELAVPLMMLGKTIGVLNLDSRKKNAFTQEQLDALTIVGTYATMLHTKITTIESLEERLLVQDILIRVAEILNGGEALKDKFSQIMRILQSELLMERGTIVLQTGSSSNYAISSAVGLSDDEIKNGVYRSGEGITGKIIATGEPYAVRNLFEDPEFLDRTKARGRMRGQGEAISFIGVPIKIKNDVVGVLSVDKPLDNKHFDANISLLTVIASLLAQALQVEELSTRERNALLQENARLKEEVQSHYSFDNMVGISPPMLDIYKKIELVANSEATVLITGESGTGKELVADAIIKRSRRLSGEVVKINCAAIPDTLLESELFGHVKGAFTGATGDKKGKIVLADRGTLFLDEIGDMPVAMQTKLLRVIQQKEVDVVGGSRPVSVDVRILAATSRNLEAMIKEGSFREDLYYRLNVFRIDIPPLRERRADVELIAREYLKKLAEREGVEYSGISYEALSMISALRLEGNVRELQNILEQAFLIAGKGHIEKFHLNISEDAAAVPPVAGGDVLSNIFSERMTDSFLRVEGGIYKSVVGEVERKLIEWALKKTGGNRSEAARMLGINRNTLNAKVRK